MKEEVEAEVHLREEEGHLEVDLEAILEEEEEISKFIKSIIDLILAVGEIMILVEAVINEDIEEEIEKNLNLSQGLVQDQEAYRLEIESLNLKEELMKNLKAKNKVRDKDQYRDHLLQNAKSHKVEDNIQSLGQYHVQDQDLDQKVNVQNQQTMRKQMLQL